MSKYDDMNDAKQAVKDLALQYDKMTLENIKKVDEVYSYSENLSFYYGMIQGLRVGHGKFDKESPSAQHLAILMIVLAKRITEKNC